MVIGLLAFLVLLDEKKYQYQYERLAWTVMALLLAFAIPVSVVRNIYYGIYWFIMPTLLVITNDSFAYIFGQIFGRTPLLKISPKKTVEGFIGGVISTFLMAFLVRSLFFS